MKQKLLLEKYGFDYIEIKFEIDPFLFPFKAPNVSYIKPYVDLNLVLSIITNEIWDQSNWNYTITLEWIVTNLANKLEKLFLEYIDVENINNKNKQVFRNLDLNIISLNNIFNLEKVPDKFNFVLDYVKLNDCINKYKNYWSKGTGFGCSTNKKTWDVDKYIKEQKNNKKNVIKIINSIINNLEDQSIVPEFIYKYLLHELSGIDIFSCCDNEEYYYVNISLLKKVCKDFNECMNFNNKFAPICKKFYDDYLLIKDTSNINKTVNYYALVIKIYFVKYFKEEKVNNSLTPEENYIAMINKENFNICELSEDHLYYNYRENHLSSKTIMRITSEIMSIKNNLPTSWDSSIILRYCENVNLLKFIIVGPKDTPYHNGLFEFHCYFPDTYPAKPPHILIETTNGGKFRFNPNLYANGKVCLSLLGTWSGEKGESWQPKLSTFLQILISIQSLILVKDPYFNEPGYEKTIHTSNGQMINRRYSDNIKINTVIISIINKLIESKEKKNSFETFIWEHFKFKRYEIINTVQKWKEESLEQNADKFDKVYKDLVNTFKDFYD